MRSVMPNLIKKSVTVFNLKVLGQLEHDKDIGTRVDWGAERVWEFLVQAWKMG